MSVLQIIFFLLISATALQLIYYIVVYSQFAFAKIKKQASNTEGVSIIVCTKNQAELLNNFVTAITSQNHPNFEIVIINNSSTDHTVDAIEQLKKKHTNIKAVNVKNNEAFWGSKKYALTLGIKAATHNQLLFTQVNCIPDNNNWISDMSSYFNDKKTIILGHSYYKSKANFINKLIRFETLITATQYFSLAKIGLPYKGIGENLAYTKTTFFDNNGFVNHMENRLGEDDLFVNEVANSKNTTICFNQSSFTQKKLNSNLKYWWSNKRRRYQTLKSYKFLHKLLLFVFYLTQLLFYTLTPILLLNNFETDSVLIIIGAKFITQYFILGFSAKKIKHSETLFLLPILEPILVLSQFILFTSSYLSKPRY